MEFLLGIISGCIFCKFINPILESLLEILFVKIEIIKENLLTYRQIYGESSH